MSRIRRTPPASAAAPAAAPNPHDPNHVVPIGDRVVDLLHIAYRSRRAVLLEGPTGVGKSQIVAEFAARAGIDYRVLDLSLLEPPDLVGLPELRDGRTHYAFPAELPTAGNGVLMLEELNRAELPVMQPALQLLSARRLHAYELPPGWFCVAAINPEDDDYQVQRLDPALRSRFLQVQVRADRMEWLRWAKRESVHPLLEQIVTGAADVFETSAPRSWSYLSDVLAKLSAAELQRRELMLPLALGYLPPAWAMRVVEALARLAADARPDLDQQLLDQLLLENGVPAFADRVARLRQTGRTDIVAMLAWKLRAELKKVDAEPRLRAMSKEQLAKWLAPLPGDLREQCVAAFACRPGAAAEERA